MYTLGFGNFSQRSQYVDLNDEVLAAFANSSLLVKIFTPPSEEGGEKGPSFAEFSIPVSSLLVSKGCLLNEITTMEGTNASVKSLGEGVDGAESSLSWRLSADNDMAEFCLGCSVLQWSGAKLDAPPSCWSIHYAGKFKFNGLFLCTGGVLFHVGCCIRQLRGSSITPYSITSITHDQYTNIYPH